MKKTMIQIYNEVTLAAQNGEPKGSSEKNLAGKKKRDLSCRLRVELSYFDSSDFGKPAVTKVIYGKKFNLTEKDSERVNFWVTQSTLEGNFLAKKHKKPEFKLEIGSNQGLAITVQSFRSLFTIFDHHLVGESNPLLPGGQVLVQNNFEDFSLQFGSQNSCLPANQQNQFCDNALARCSSPVETGNSLVCLPTTVLVHDVKRDINVCANPPKGGTQNGFSNSLGKIIACNRGFVFVNGDCKKCAKNCLLCFGPKESQCSMCEDNFWLKESKCLACEWNEIYDPEFRTCRYDADATSIGLKEKIITSRGTSLKFEMNPIEGPSERQAMILEFSLDYPFQPVPVYVTVEISSKIKGHKRRQHIFTDLESERSRKIVLRTKAHSSEQLSVTIRVFPESNVNIDSYSISDARYLLDRVHGSSTGGNRLSIKEKLKETVRIEAGQRMTGSLIRNGWNVLDLKKGNWLQTWYKFSQDSDIKEQNVVAFRYWINENAQKKLNKSYVDGFVFYDREKNELRLSHQGTETKIVDYKEYSEKKWQFMSLLFRVVYNKTKTKEKFQILFYNYFKSLTTAEPVTLFETEFAAKPYLRQNVPIQASFGVKKFDDQISSFTGLLFGPTFYKTYMLNDYYLFPKVSVEFNNRHLSTVDGKLKNLMADGDQFAEARQVFINMDQKVVPFYGEIVPGRDSIRVLPRSSILSNPIESNKIVYGEWDIRNDRYAEMIKVWGKPFKQEYEIYSMYTADQKCVVKISHRIRRKEIQKIGPDGKSYLELSNVIEHRMFYKIRLRPTKDREVIFNVVSKKFYIEHLPDANLLYQFWLETSVDDDHYKHGSDSDMVNFEFRDSIGTNWSKKTYKNFVDNPMNVHYVLNSLDNVQADFLEVQH
jgi:hypothetical protein